MSEPGITVNVPLDDETHRFLMEAMHGRYPIPWPGLRPREGQFFVEGISYEADSPWEVVTVVPA